MQEYRLRDWVLGVGIVVVMNAVLIVSVIV